MTKKKLSSAFSDQHAAEDRIDVTFFEVLSQEEETRRQELEKIVESSFVEAGRALRQLRDEKLYRGTHQTFEQYCKERFGYLTRRQPYRIIEASVVVENLVQKCDQIGHIISPVFPANEAQVRPLTKLDPDSQWEAWQQAVKEADGKVPPSRIVKSVVDRICEKKLVPINFVPGEVCQIVVKENPDLRGRGGQWCIIREVYDFCCLVQCWDTVLENPLKPEHLKSMEYSSNERQEIQKLAERLQKIPLNQVDGPVRNFLKSFGELKRPYLLPVEDKILEVIELDLDYFD